MSVEIASLKSCLSGLEKVLGCDIAAGQLLFDSYALLEAEVLLHVRVHHLVLIWGDTSITVEETAVHGEEVSHYGLGITHIDFLLFYYNKLD